MHIDYAGPVAGSMLLIVVDAFSKWMEVKPTLSTTTAVTIKMLDELFASYGVPVTIVSDNGPQFTATEFKDFLQRSGVKYHKLSAPYHPATNGQAERYVQTVKKGLKAMGTTSGNLQPNLNKFLQQYRKIPHCETGESPASLFLGRNIRTILDLIRPQNVKTTTTEKQQSLFDPSFRSFEPGQTVYTLSGNARMDKWIRGVIFARIGDLHYEIIYNGKHLKRHIDQIRNFDEDSNNNNNNNNNSHLYTPTSVTFSEASRSAETPRNVPINHDQTTSNSSTTSTSFNTGSGDISIEDDSSEDSFTTPSSSPQQQENAYSLRRSGRVRRAPLRYSPT